VSFTWVYEAKIIKIIIPSSSFCNFDRFWKDTQKIDLSQVLVSAKASFSAVSALNRTGLWQ
jgi:hypothetical protein